MRGCDEPLKVIADWKVPWNNINNRYKLRG